MQRLTSRVFAQAPSSCDRLKCQAWNSGCALEAELIGRLRLRRLCVFTANTALTDLTVTVPGPMALVLVDGLRFDAVFPQDWLYVSFIGDLTLPRLSFALQNGWGFTDPATKPAPFPFSRHHTRMQDESRAMCIGECNIAGRFALRCFRRSWMIEVAFLRFVQECPIEIFGPWNSPAGRFRVASIDF